MEYEAHHSELGHCLILQQIAESGEEGGQGR